MPMKDIRKILIGAALIVIQALLIGLVANIANPQGVPLFRSPLRDMHSTYQSLPLESKGIR